MFTAIGHEESCDYEPSARKFSVLCGRDLVQAFTLSVYPHLTGPASLRDTAKTPIRSRADESVRLVMNCSVT